MSAGTIGGFTYSTIPTGSTDPDSPLDTVLMQQLADNDEMLFRWLGQSYTPTADHGHNGTDSKKIAYSDISGPPSIPSAPVVAFTTGVCAQTLIGASNPATATQTLTCTNILATASGSRIDIDAVVYNDAFLAASESYAKLCFSFLKASGAGNWVGCGTAYEFLAGTMVETLYPDRTSATGTTSVALPLQVQTVTASISGVDTNNISISITANDPAGGNTQTIHFSASGSAVNVS